MAHLSENSKRLKRSDVQINDYPDLLNLNIKNNDIFFISIPFSISDKYKYDELNEKIFQFSESLASQSILAILTTPKQAAEIYIKLKSVLKYQLWIALKLAKPIVNENILNSDHVSLLILSKYKGSLKHTTTRIAYTYCPFCDKTTKDYGGKKHLYHEYGTLLSDVWRDIPFNPENYPEDLLIRLQDLFGVEPHKILYYLNFNNLLKPSSFIKDINVDYYFDFFNSTKDNNHESILINSDSLIALKDIPNNSIDFCFADPPYNIQKKYDTWDDTLDIQDYFSWCDKWLLELSRVLKPGCVCAILNIPLWAIRHFSYMQTVLNYIDWIVWEGLSLPVRMIMPSHYTILIFSKGKPRKYPGLIRIVNSPLEKIALKTLKENYCSRYNCVNSRRKQGIIDSNNLTNLWWDIHRLKHNSRRVDHPTQLPPRLMHRLISLFTNENEIVLDPFNGSGTTSLAAEQLNRKFIGIEISEYYHGIALKRHNDLRLGIDPFHKNDTIPKAKNSRVKRLPKQKYEVSKKTLQLEIKRISKQLGKIPTKKEVEIYSHYPFKYFDEYFIDWGEACAAARTTGMSESRNKSKNQSKIVEQLNIFDHNKKIAQHNDAAD